MSFRINILPSEQSFTAQHDETILDAALRAGVNLSFNCSSGGCGDCKAKIIAGEYKAVNHFDYVFTEAEKIQQQVLLCSTAARSDMIIDAMEAVSTQDIPQQQITVKVAKLEKHSDQYLVIHIRTPRSKALLFHAGQTVTLTTSQGLSKSLFVASCPCNGMVLQFHFDKHKNDLFTRYVFEDLKVGESLELTGPNGDFTLDESSQRPSVMIAQDTGFAPMKSLIEHAIALDRPLLMHLFWIVSDEDALYQSNFCRAWEDAYDLFVFTPLVIGATDELNAQMIDTLVQNVVARSPIESEMDLYLACSPELSAAFDYAFLDRGTPAERIFTAEMTA